MVKMRLHAVVFLFALFSSLPMACGAGQSEAPDLSSVIQHVDPDLITAALMDSALPRLTEDEFIFRLRGGETDLLRGGPENDSLKNSLIIGGYLTAARWEWALFLQRQRTPKQSSKNSAAEFSKLLSRLRFAMEDNLIKVNHRLKRLSAPQALLEQIDKLKAHFAASAEKFPTVDFAAIDQSLDQLAKKIRLVMMQNKTLETSFAFGEWLVWEAELSNLCLRADKKKAPYFTEVMNQLYKRIDLNSLSKLSERLLGAEGARSFLRSLTTLKSTFLVKTNRDVQRVRAEVTAILDLLELTFPSLS
jgi:hypothetical protein